MPGRNGIPMGRGPMTGRGMGGCGGANAQSGPGFGPGLGRGAGRGGGWGHRHCFRATGLTGWQRASMGWPGDDASQQTAPSKEQELLALKQQAAELELAMAEVRSRLQELEKREGNDAALAGPGERSR